MRNHNGDAVTAEEVLDSDELAAYYRQHPEKRHQATGYEHLNIGADPAVVAWGQSLEEHLVRGEE